MTDAKANALPARPWNSSTVSISDLDSLEQAMAWRRLGPQAALHSFVMMLRMALLSADYVYIDRNQLLDGVCFLALGPDGLAEALGLPSYQDLPLLVGCQPPAGTPAGFARPASAKERAEWADLQRRQVEREGFVSAARAVFECEMPTAHSVTEGHARLALLLQGLNETEAEDGHPYPAYCSIPRSRQDPARLIETGRDQWVRAMEDMRVHLMTWPRTPSVEDAAFWDNHGRLEDLEDTEAIAIARTLRAWLPKWIANDGGEVTRPARRGDVVSLLSHWMEEAPPADLDTSEGELYRNVLTAPQARCALRWFSLLYEDAAMHQRLALLDTATSRMSFTMIADDDGTDDAEVRVQRQWGMCVPPQSRKQYWRARVQENIRLTLARMGLRIAPKTGSGRGGLGGSARGLSVNGEITEAMGTLSPEQYQRVLTHPMTAQARAAQLELSALRDAHPAEEIRVKRASRNAWRSLALFIREFEVDPVEWRRRVFSGVLRCVAVTILAFFLTAHDSGWFGEDTLWMNVLWTAIAFLASFPYSDVRELFKLRPSSMMSEIRLAQA
jgi:hypothetical protein